MKCPTTGKQGYESAREAQAALDLIERRISDGTILDMCYARRAYLCPDCDDFHLSKKGAKHYNPTDVYPTSVRGPVS